VHGAECNPFFVSAIFKVNAVPATFNFH